MTTKNTNKTKQQSQGPMKYELMDINIPIPYPKNSKKHPEENIKMLMASISEVGLIRPIQVDKDMVIVAGHGRLEACKRLGFSVVKVEVLSHLTPNQIKQARISDNKTASLEYDANMFLEELGEIDLEGVDVMSLGFTQEEFDKFTADYNELDLSALATDLDEEIDKQAKQSERDIKTVDETTLSVSVALGFKSIPISASKDVAMFVAALQDDYGGTPEQAFIKFTADFNAGEA